MQQIILPATGPINATITVPGSKSITNRALLLAALASGETFLDGVLWSDDTQACLNALQALGVLLQINSALGQVKVQGAGGPHFQSGATINCRDAGTVARFLLPAAALAAGEFHFTGSKRLAERPMAPLIETLQQQGALFQFTHQANHLPFLLKANGLLGGQISIDIHDSSQFLSGLMLAAPYMQKAVHIESSLLLANKPYVQMTAAMMAAFGIDCQLSEHTVAVKPGHYQGIRYTIEPDASTASYFFALAALTAGRVHVGKLSRHALQGDVKFLTVLEKMGAQVIEENQGITVIGASKLKGLGDIDLSGFTDTFMTLAMLAVFADAPTTIHGLRHTRLQESDRIAAIEKGLNDLGIRTQSTEDSLTVYPGTPHGAIVQSFNDHRIAMSLALIGIRTPGVVINGAECVAKTCPDYFKLLSIALKS